jgi:arylformamidase
MTAPRDLTMLLDETTPRFPGDPGVEIRRVRSLERGDPYRLSALAFGSHAGTHLDAPSHFLAQGATVDTVDLGLLNGPAWVIALPPSVGPIGARELAGVPDGTERLLLRTRNSSAWARGEGFRDDYAALTPEGADRLVERGLRLVGVDGLSVESDPTLRFPVHHRLLAAGCWILEGLMLDGVPEGAHELRCLPLRLRGVDGSPCRAVLWD